MPRVVNILEDAGAALLDCKSPARYAGGELGGQAYRESTLQAVFAFPDLYEIGMANSALKIIYSELNKLKDISCDRVFAAAPDFEALLREKNIPLYGLETGLALSDTDLLLFTLSYELCATTVLAMLNLGGVPIHSSERKQRAKAGEHIPIVIAGGPCAANPLPFSPFFDGFWIGEAEAGFFELACELRDAKQRGEDRAVLLSIIESNEAFWTETKPKARRAVYRDFGKRASAAASFPLPSLRIVQEHGNVEIMRGCPNGCRFCHAGVWYSPPRQKPPEQIEEEAAALIREGYREISLASLSSGDYKGIDTLLDKLIEQNQSSNVSFQLPSLHVSTFSLDLLDKVSCVRKSGLTFAVESPLESIQTTINKHITLEMVTSMLQRAKKSGYKSAKFYFMIGLGETPDLEAEAIINFVNNAAKHSRMHFSVSVGVFIPKPHTPLQFAAQLNPQPAHEALFKIFCELKKHGHKVSTHDAFCSYIEGIISRGDERAAVLIEKAYEQGCRLDPWTDYFKREIWQQIVCENAALVEEFTGARQKGAALPWDCIKK